MRAPAILFDMGNTILHYHEGPLSDREKDELGLRAMVTLLGAFGIASSFEELCERFYEPWLSLCEGRKTQEREYDLFESLGRAVPLFGLSPEQLRALVLAFHKPAGARAVSDEGTAETLARLRRKGYRLGLLSNSAVPGYCHDYTLAKLGLLERFDFRLYSYEEQLRKPDPRLFDKALRRAGSDASTTTLVGDSLELDLAPAARLGMRVIRYHSPRRGAKKPMELPPERHLGDVDTIPMVERLVEGRGVRLTA
ncbi:MAG: HAD-IA family hydrolase [Oligoflexia bacterium]|nr:HAD-IA family hydrolase [Oligoflexia bacterium]